MLDQNLNMEPWIVLVAPHAENGDFVPRCKTGGNDTSHFGLRVASIFIILIGSLLGSVLPICLTRSSKMQAPQVCFFAAKYFGSGVILATAWMHLLSPASEALKDPCLASILPDYDWAMAIALMTVMATFLVELIASSFDFGPSHSHSHGAKDATAWSGGTEGHRQPSDKTGAGTGDPEAGQGSSGHEATGPPKAPGSNCGGPFVDAPVLGFEDDLGCPPGSEQRLGSQRSHLESDGHAAFATQMTALFMLEFGVVFHSVFIGLTLAISDEFIVLFVVLVFHQTFEGLGLGSRLATVSWPADRRRWTPYVLALGYAVSTPISVAVGLGVRATIQTQGATMLLVNGIFDAISGGVLMYTSLVELLAQEFRFNSQMRDAGLRIQLYAYAYVAAGAGLMALLAKWA